MDSDVIRKTLKSLSQGLRQVTMVLNETVGPLLQKQQTLLSRQDEDIRALYEIDEMMLYVMIRAQAEGVFDETSLSDEDSVLTCYNRLSALQDEYLATRSVSVFLSRLNPEDD